ncbi:uncharacterized protein LOC123307910 [Coccinella septempunctata]|uniref:uncharacterized protein LOC123307910 n=1 Tax=Coccinella septempunctata TaxID=41139 RepID=UPI001D0689DE|nr:uncharacterized protein LOC123307910 [Coccinella septempunctata]
MTRCSYKNCKSDSRKNKNIKFRPFPKMKRNPTKCLKWIKLCGNEKLTVDTINKNSYVCSKHFCGKFTTDSNPLPFSQDQSDTNDSENGDTEQVTATTSAPETYLSPRRSILDTEQVTATMSAPETDLSPRRSILDKATTSITIHHGI